MTDTRIVVTTVGSADEARRIAEALVGRKLAACVNILPKITSIYRWKGKIEDSEEWMLWIKTTQAAVEEVRDTIKELHSYDLPECLCLAIEDGSQEYLDWVRESVGEFGGEDSE
jgi:periplasmic divalent cation tolerance protein